LGAETGSKGRLFAGGGVMSEEPMMTEAQRDELKILCAEADVPDKSGELLTKDGAQHFIDDFEEAAR
jgi:hypothetical protein